jgi:hypothetical protein
MIRRPARALLFGLSLTIASGAAAELNMELVGGINSSSATLTYTPAGISPSYFTASGTAQSGTQFGVLFDGGMTSGLSIQTGVLSITRSFTESIVSTYPGLAGTIGATAMLKSYQIPFLIRYSPVAYISIGVGAVYNSPDGGVTESNQTDTIPGSTMTSSASQSYGQAGINAGDMAAVVSLDFKIPLTSSINFYAAGDYQKGLTNMDTTGTMPTKINVVQALAGFGFSLGSEKSSSRQSRESY